EVRRPTKWVAARVAFADELAEGLPHRAAALAFLAEINERIGFARQQPSSVRKRDEREAMAYWTFLCHVAPQSISLLLRGVSSRLSIRNACSAEARASRSTTHSGCGFGWLNRSR